MEQQLYLPFVAQERRTSVRHGAYRDFSPFSVEQLKYVGTGNEGIGGFAEVLRVQNPPRNHLPYIAVGYRADWGYYAIEVTSAEMANEVFDALIFFFAPALELRDPLQSAWLKKVLPLEYVVLTWTHDPWFYPRYIR